MTALATLIIGLCLAVPASGAELDPVIAVCADSRRDLASKSDTLRKLGLQDATQSNDSALWNRQVWAELLGYGMGSYDLDPQIAELLDQVWGHPETARSAKLATGNTRLFIADTGMVQQVALTLEPAVMNGRGYAEDRATCHIVMNAAPDMTAYGKAFATPEGAAVASQMWTLPKTDDSAVSFDGIRLIQLTPGPVFAATFGPRAPDFPALVIVSYERTATP